MIFVCNSKLFSYDHVSKWFECPSPYIQWDCTEWSNHPDFAVSLANTSNYSDNAVFTIKLSDSSYFKICESSTVSDPFLWIDPSEVSEQQDPYRFFGKYDIPVQTYYQQFAAKKFRLFWYYKQEIECAVVGSSPAFYGIEPNLFSLRTLNMSRCGGILLANTYIVNNYILPHSPNIKALIIELTPYTLNLNPFVGRAPMGGLYESKGMELDTSMHFYQSGIPDEINAKINDYNSNDWTELDTAGYPLIKP